MGRVMYSDVYLLQCNKNTGTFGQPQLQSTTQMHVNLADSAPLSLHQNGTENLHVKLLRYRISVRPFT